jgi:hypothetical protein
VLAEIADRLSRTPGERGDGASGDEGTGEVASDDDRLANGGSAAVGWRGCFSVCMAVLEETCLNFCGLDRNPDDRGEGDGDSGEGGEDNCGDRMCGINEEGWPTTALLFWGKERGEGA